MQIGVTLGVTEMTIELSEMATLSGVSATSLITLKARADENRLSDSLLHDGFATSAVEKLSCDFSRISLSHDGVVGLAIRASVLDGWVKEFLQAHPDAVVLHLGCGLDSRFYRVPPPMSVRWFNIDFPKVMALRRQLYPTDSGDIPIEASVTSDGWLEKIPAEAPTLIVAEGLFPYLSSTEIHRLFDRLLNHFSSGELIFDVYSWLGLKFLNRMRCIRTTGAQLQWSMNNPLELETIHNRLKLVEERTQYDPAKTRRLSLPLRFLYRFTPMRRVARLVRYRFGDR